MDTWRAWGGNKSFKTDSQGWPPHEPKELHVKSSEQAEISRSQRKKQTDCFGSQRRKIQMLCLVKVCESETTNEAWIPNTFDSEVSDFWFFSRLKLYHAFSGWEWLLHMPWVKKSSSLLFFYRRKSCHLKTIILCPNIWIFITSWIMLLFLTLSNTVEHIHSS